MLLIGAVAISLMMGLLALVGGLGYLYDTTLRKHCLESSTSLAAASPASLSGTGLTVKGQDITVLQEKNAATIIGVGLDNGLSERDATIAIMTAMQESTLASVPFGYPGSSSVGLFQQIAAWGSYVDRMNPIKSSYMFYFGGLLGQRGLTDIVGRENMSLGDAAQAVQRSGYPDAYDQHEPEARAIVAAYTSGDSGSIVQASMSFDCPSEDPIEDAVLAALSKRGSDYDWQDTSGSGLTSWAFSEAGIGLPDMADDLRDYAGDETKGVSASWLSASEVNSATDIRRGDIILSSTDDDDDAEDVSIALGSGPISDSTSLRIGTFNVLGVNHTSVASAKARIKKSARLIVSSGLGVVGMQELRPMQRTALLKLLGHYDIYPKRPVYGRNDVSVNSVIWDSNLFERVDGTTTPMPFYFGRRHKDIPLVKLRDRRSGQEFYVVNTHDPARPKNDYLRYLNAEAHARLMERLKSEGVPMYFVGDFNSGFGVRMRYGNTTYQDERHNLTWCIMTRTGTMRNAYDASVGRSGCPKKTTAEKGVGVVDHVYVSKGVSVEEYVVVHERTGSDHPLVYVVATHLGGNKMVGASHNAVKIVKPKSKWHALTVGKKRNNIDITQVDTRRVVAVLRLTITTTGIVPVSADVGTWTAPVKVGTYQLPSSDGGKYGWRIHPVRGTSDFHNGIDLGAGTGTLVYSIGGGTVVKAYYDDCWGNLVIVNHGEFISMYDHLSSFANGLSEGDTVSAGQQVGEVGNTGGCSAGAHLHFTVGTSLEILRGEQAGSVDPSLFMRERGVVL